MQDNISHINARISSFKRKYYLSLGLKGILIFLGLLLSVYLIINTLEYSFRFGSLVRATLLIVFITTAIIGLIKYVISPFYQLFYKGMNDEEAARKIGAFFPEVSDKLLNIIQLQNENYKDNTLQKASIVQKSKVVSAVEFTAAIDYSANAKYLKYLFIPIGIIIFTLVLSPSLFTTSTERIVKFNEEFAPVAPFSFKITNEDLLAFKNEDLQLTLSLEGEAIPEDVYIISDRKVKMQPVESGTFTFTFKKIQNNKHFKFEAAGFESRKYMIEVVSRPDLKNFNVYLNFPRYLNKKGEVLSNVGNLQIPEGTSVRWQLKTLESNQASIKFTKSEAPNNLQQVDNQLFEYERSFRQSDLYSLLLKNEYSENKEKILYKVDVIPDEYPKIDLNVYQDTVLYSYIALGGNITDDHGLRTLKLNYQVINSSGTEGDVKQIDIPINREQTSQRYYYQWMVDSLNIKEGHKIKYWMAVSDNDGVNGSKSSKTGTYEFKVPSKKEIENSIAEKSTQTENNIDNRLEEAKELKKKIEEAENKLKGKKELNWQDQNLLKDILRKREELNEALEELKKQNQELNVKRDRFNKTDEQFAEKVEQLQQLMDDLLDEDTKKLYDELKKLLEEQSDIDQIQDALNQLNKKEDNLEKELERTLELFKRMKFDRELSDAIEDISEQIEKQEELLDETDGKTPDKESTEDSEQKSEQSDVEEQDQEGSNSLTEKQKELQEEFKEFEKKLEGLKKQNQDLKNPKSIPDTQQEQEEVKNNQQQSQENLQKNNKNKAKKAQQQAKEQMKKIAEQLEQMQMSMQMSMMQENLDDLRDIVHNLIKLSFDQEELMTDFGGVKQSDPRFITLSQEQLKLKDDAKIVEDSLLSLAKRVFQIASFVTREVTEMNEHMDNSVAAIKERKKPKAIAEQQFAMTSMNNLALLLDDVLQQMQQAMQDAMGSGTPQDQKGEGLSLSELQRQLNQQIEDLKKSGKSGRQLSEELARLAAQQERIRKALQELQEGAGEGDNGLSPGQGIQEKMEETESDLVNKNITDKTIERQKQILTRLLQAEESLRERELDNERKGETAKDYENTLPKAFEEYFNLKEKEIELLKTVPPKLYPYYKKEVTDYFKRLENGTND